MRGGKRVAFALVYACIMPVKRLLTALAVALVFIGTVHAQELVVNGSFESASLAPWTVTTGSATLVNGASALNGAYSCRFSGTSSQIGQGLPTTPGTRYFATALLYGSATQLAAYSDSGVLGYTPVNSRGFIFTASGTTSYIFAQSFADGGEVDNISVTPIPLTSKLAGTYKGTATGALFDKNGKQLQHAAQAAQATVGSDNKLVIVHGAQRMYGGFLLDNGIFELAMDAQYITRGIATISGKTVTLTVPYFSLTGPPNSADHFGNSIGTSSLTFKLTRVAN